MSADPQLDAYFAQSRADGIILAPGKPIVLSQIAQMWTNKLPLDLPKFDLESYIGNYSGRTQVDRLLHIAAHSPLLAVEALKLAIKILKQTQDVPRYKHAVDLLRKISQADSEAVQDDAWAEKTSKKVAADTEKIEADLKSYKHNLIKESIRMGHEDLGKHLYTSGDLSGAFKCYTRMRDFCTTSKHIVDMSMQIARVCIEQGSYVSVGSHVLKIRNLIRTPDEEEELKPVLSIFMGLTHLSTGDFRGAAKSFLECPSTLGSSFNDVVSANDVAIYGGLCALASMERTQLKSHVLDNSDFRNFLELEPQMRRAISFFHTAKYSSCLAILADYRSDYILDIHLHKHVNRLYESIRSKGIVQYFIPFSCVTLKSMAEAFVTNEETLEKELVGMIGRGTLDARIDTQNKLLTAKQTNLRANVHRETLEVTQNYERLARMKLMRMNMIRAGLEIRGPKPGQGVPVGSGVLVGQGPWGSLNWKEFNF